MKYRTETLYNQKHAVLLSALNESDLPTFADN